MAGMFTLDDASWAALLKYHYSILTLRAMWAISDSSGSTFTPQHLGKIYAECVNERQHGYWL